MSVLKGSIRQKRMSRRVLGPLALGYGRGGSRVHVPREEVTVDLMLNRLDICGAFGVEQSTLRLTTSLETMVASLAGKT